MFFLKNKHLFLFYIQVETSVGNSLVTLAQSTPAAKINNKNPNSIVSKKDSSYTLLTLVSCAVYLIGNFIDCFSDIAVIFSFDIYVKYGFINITGNILFYSSHSIHFFIFYTFNNVFRKQFKVFFRLRR